MTAVTTPRKPKAERRMDDSASQNFVEDIKEYSAECYRRRILELLEQRRQAGFGDDDPFDPDDPLDMQIIVSICKEARAEISVEKQRNENRNAERV